MMDSEFHIPKDSPATLVSVIAPHFESHSSEIESQRSMNELQELLRTLNIPVSTTHIQPRKSIDPASIVGSGKLKEIAEIAEANNSKLLVFDFELSASQVRNIKELTGLSVVDRVHVILEIFAEHARTREAKIQIEIARLQYMLPRLSGFWSHLGRQRGGVGVRGGEGEQQIELDRRMIRERIEFFKKELKDISKSREQQKKKRRNQAVTAALVGYTNAGKSSVLNRLCKEQILEEDKLFATLDSTHRMLNPDTKPPMILIDTVGFISNLPNTLIEGFKTTLESAIEADLLIIVCDISDPHYKKQLEVTHNVLKELGVDDKDQIIVFNKKDQVTDPFLTKMVKRQYPNSFVVSTLDKEDMKNLRTWIINFFLEKQNHYDLFIPYDHGEAIAMVASKANIITQHTHETGIFYRLRCPANIFEPTGLAKYALSAEEVEKLNPAHVED
ncbi:MAG: GTPase HflX [Bdellovibrio sp. CG12_big_fil_rev_8_21_14_0_65_39_13]|nr:MAG: GTPase HflX [Bdellovibrio sp. CG22_combo_CG10-13_8_21_14_all_39_27]PIQ58480.1 MAG: GTPase HflX [Bdellovibrio sp. CG12_big_fil_rev_8_21_14_0_65_39_13]PIR35431.1 MAG: GTPase HflX [Bdellovibrio sp. CG11_big_fil_rev_8_21_14_0_20_39_38]PJB53269.1 MAG: GTPase HflX [Bdellovibrio sp. CG_4_9_14_3_um_filter_39_7]